MGDRISSFTEGRLSWLTDRAVDNKSENAKTGDIGEEKLHVDDGSLKEEHPNGTDADAGLKIGGSDSRAVDENVRKPESPGSESEQPNSARKYTDSMELSPSVDQGDGDVKTEQAVEGEGTGVGV